MVLLLVIVAALIVTPLVMALILPKEFVVISEIVIEKPEDEVFDYVTHLKNQKHYSKWIMADPKIQMDYHGKDGTAGFIAAWKSNIKNVGAGEQEITKIIEGQGYDVEIRFEKPLKAVSHASIRIKALSDYQTQVTTTFVTRTAFPMNAMTAVMKTTLLKDMDQNSANLKKVLEKGK
ncbi:MAG: SRPBCC family protein [Bacteroidota bacterium]